MKTLSIIAAAALSLAWSSVAAAVKLPQLFQNGMVMQRNQPIPVWGTADKGETVTITFLKKTYGTTADANGKWRIDLPKQKAGGPYTMTVNDKTIDDILIGDVWIVSGQSNIDTNLERIYPQYGKELDDYKNDNIRLFHVNNRYVTERQADVLPTSWKYCNKDNAWHFSAVGYFLGQKMYNDTKVPQGIIQASMGGTDIQAWMDIDSLRNYPGNYYTNYLLYTDKEYVDAQTRANNRAGEVWNKALNNIDKGVGKYEKADYDDSQWKKYSQYDNNQWARHNGRAIIGSMWLRQHVTIDKAHAGMAATLNIGTFHDMDYTYVNGKQVGVTYYQYPPRRYKVPAGLLKEGDNVITIRLICKTGMANFYKDKPHNITFENGDVQQTSTEWLTMTGGVMPEGPLGGKINTQNQASVLYNGMLYPLAPYAISGVVWYQGENNTGRAYEYGQMLEKLTGNWRTLWNRPTLPFNIVQLANYMEPSDGPQDGGWPQLREKQRVFTDNDPYSTLTVGIDLGEASDIHPLRKRELTERIAMALQNSVFNKKYALSPEPVSAVDAKEGFEITMSQQLKAVEELKEFEVMASDGKFRNAKASCKGNKVIVSPDFTVVLPVKIRYAWKNNPAKANLYGVNGLPASPFEIKVQMPNDIKNIDIR